MLVTEFYEIINLCTYDTKHRKCNKMSYLKHFSWRFTTFQSGCTTIILIWEIGWNAINKREKKLLILMKSKQYEQEITFH